MIRGIFAGWTTQALQAAERSLQQAILDLASGAKGEVFAYTQGDGNKSVTYTRAQLPQMNALLQDIRYQLYGKCAARRRPIGFTFT